MAAKGYWIFQMDVHDMEGWKAYSAAAAPVLMDYGGRFLVRGGRADHVEGAAPARSVVVEFPDYEAAVACWNSPGYTAAKAVRLPCGSGHVTLVEGIDADGH